MSKRTETIPASLYFSDFFHIEKGIIFSIFVAQKHSTLCLFLLYFNKPLLLWISLKYKTKLYLRGFDEWELKMHSPNKKISLKIVIINNTSSYAQLIKKIDRVTYIGVLVASMMNNLFHVVRQMKILRRHIYSTYKIPYLMNITNWISLKNK